MNHFVTVNIINQYDDVKLLGRVWFEYDTKKSRIETIDYEVRKRVAEYVDKDLFHLEPGKDYITSFQKFKKDNHSIFFPEQIDTEDQWILIQNYTPAGNLKTMNEILIKAKMWSSLDEKIASFYEDDGDKNPAGLLTIGEIAASAFGYL